MHPALSKPLGLWFCASLAWAAAVGAAQSAAPATTARSTPMRRVPASRIVPFYGAVDGAAVSVAAFDMDTRPVTNAQFLAFVRASPRWRRTEVPRLFADALYLSHWEGALALGTSARPEQPVVRVSWFAARAFCASRGARLPTELEWELAARANAERADASRDPEFVQQILRWYASRHRELADVAQQPANFYGLHDLHGLVWEWVEDFNASMVSADDRARDDDQSSRVCGAAAFGATDPADYATFMRFAFRSSLSASYSVPNLGFRCARSVEGTQ